MIYAKYLSTMTINAVICKMGYWQYLLYIVSEILKIINMSLRQAASPVEEEIITTFMPLLY